jgi:hypothetical protein
MSFPPLPAAGGTGVAGLFGSECENRRHVADLIGITQFFDCKAGKFVENRPSTFD